ncbi:MAG: hypothetical protein ACRDHN_19655, partial [Thermomicrobiales bacterium]
MSVLMSIREKAPAPKKAPPLPAISIDEVNAFQALRVILGQSRLLQYLDKKDITSLSERVVSINENILAQHYPGIDPLSGRLPGIDAFIYVYDGITHHDLRRPSTRGDVRQYLGEIGFREMLLELDRACHIHRYCCEHARFDGYRLEPITNKP